VQSRDGLCVLSKNSLAMTKDINKFEKEKLFSPENPRLSGSSEKLTFLSNAKITEKSIFFFNTIN
jgi:hypothetical protein